MDLVPSNMAYAFGSDGCLTTIDEDESRNADADFSTRFCNSGGRSGVLIIRKPLSRKADVTAFAVAAVGLLSLSNSSSTRGKSVLVGKVSTIWEPMVIEMQHAALAYSNICST